MLRSPPLRISRIENIRRNEHNLAPLHAALRLLLFRSLFPYLTKFKQGVYPMKRSKVSNFKLNHYEYWIYPF